MENQMRVELSPPWETYVKELTALFSLDKEVKVIYDRDNNTVRLYVDNEGKAEALAELLNDKLEFGGQTLCVVIMSGNYKSSLVRATGLFEKAFYANPVLIDVISRNYPSVGTMMYVVWTDKAAQFFNDNLGDYCGNKTILMEAIARDVFKPTPGVYHCTEQIPAWAYDKKCC